MENTINTELSEPLIVKDDSGGGGDLENDDEDEFHDAISSSSPSIITTTTTTSSSPTLQKQQPPLHYNPPYNNFISAAEISYYGKVSPLSTGTLFPSSRGIVDALPSSLQTSVPCLLFADHDPIGAISHICLLEKEMDYQQQQKEQQLDDTNILSNDEVSPTTELFSVVNVCEPLANQNDAGMRILKKINKQHQRQHHGASEDTTGSNSSNLPILIHEGNIHKEVAGQQYDDDINDAPSLGLLLLPEYIDECIGIKRLLRPKDATGLYNMKLVRLLQCITRVKKYSRTHYLHAYLLLMLTYCVINPSSSFNDMDNCNPSSIKYSPIHHHQNDHNTHPNYSTY